MHSRDGMWGNPAIRLLCKMSCLFEKNFVVPNPYFYSDILRGATALMYYIYLVKYTSPSDLY